MDGPLGVEPAPASRRIRRRLDQIGRARRVAAPGFRSDAAVRGPARFRMRSRAWHDERERLPIFREGRPVDHTLTRPHTLSAAEIDAIDAWWRAANYLTIGQ